MSLYVAIWLRQKADFGAVSCQYPARSGLRPDAILAEDWIS
jgi:hypothetical protein